MAGNSFFSGNCGPGGHKPAPDAVRRGRSQRSRNGNIDGNPCGGVPRQRRLHRRPHYHHHSITLKDINLIGPRFVGTGPNNELANLDQIDNATGAINFAITGGNGERVLIPPGQLLGSTLTVVLAANPIGAAGATPLADRNDDGFVNVADVVIVNTDVNGDGVGGDIRIASIFNADRGIIQVNIFQDGLGGRTFDVRYATPGQKLARAVKLFAESHTVPTESLIAPTPFPPSH